MFQWFMLLDPTVQVAVIAPLMAALVAFVSGIIVWFGPKSHEKEKEYAPKPILITLDDPSRQRIDRLVFVLEALADTIERHRVELAHSK